MTSKGALTTVHLTADELLTIVAALHTVTPIGGGSDQFFLAGKLGARLEATREALDAKIGEYTRIVIEEHDPRDLLDDYVPDSIKT